MAFKQVDIENIGPVKLYKRKGARSIRLSINGAGQVRVSLPYWAPYSSGVNFLLTKRAFIADWRQKNNTPLLKNGQAIGKAHHLYFIGSSNADKIATRINGTAVNVTYPAAISSTDAAVQAAAERACLRALKLQARQLLPQRLQSLAAQHSFSYNNLQFKRLTGRWGSCDSHQNITLNIYLMNLPWRFIDYVLIHELVHTEHMNHQKDFWQKMSDCLTGAKSLRKELHQYQTTLLASSNQA